MRNLPRSVGSDDFARRLRRIMNAREIRAAELQRRLASQGVVTPNGKAVYYWLRGRMKPRNERLTALARLLQVTENVLTGDHTLRFDGCAGGFSASCDTCRAVYHLEGSRHTVPELDRFELMHWGIAT